MTAAIGIAVCAALALSIWLYDHGLANVLEAVAIRLIRHAQWLRARHARQQQRQAKQLELLHRPTFEYLADRGMLVPTFEEMVERR